MLTSRLTLHCVKQKKSGTLNACIILTIENLTLDMTEWNLFLLYTDLKGEGGTPILTILISMSIDISAELYMYILMM